MDKDAQQTAAIGFWAFCILAGFALIVWAAK